MNRLDGSEPNDYQFTEFEPLPSLDELQLGSDIEKSVEDLYIAKIEELNKEKNECSLVNFKDYAINKISTETIDETTHVIIRVAESPLNKNKFQIKATEDVKQRLMGKNLILLDYEEERFVPRRLESRNITYQSMDNKEYARVFAVANRALALISQAHQKSKETEKKSQSLNERTFTVRPSTKKDAIFKRYFQSAYMRERNAKERAKERLKLEERIIEADQDRKRHKKEREKKSGERKNQIEITRNYKEQLLEERKELDLKKSKDNSPSKH